MDNELFGMRSDCVRDNRAVFCRNSSRLGFSIQSAKRGCWICYNADGVYFVGRMIGRVTCDGVVYLEVASAAIDFSSVYPRWVLPLQVITCRRVPPKQVFEFLNGPWADVNTILPRLQRGFLPPELANGAEPHEDSGQAFT